ncbi:YraN family protein [Pontibacter roseus]|uniref:YraN family protein n=1 Tax=Pontibacter roseus TaxID=336989 RepID=UPI000361BCA9|nr:YraN family protein [Pontibacter roseus]
MAKTRVSHLSTGSQGEDQAAAYLREQGYDVLRRNYRTGKAEVDIIAQKGGILVFVEVKTRANDVYGFPEEAVSARKQQMLLNAADAYISETGWQHDIRFDIISITLGKPPELFHIEDAFH